MAPGDLQEVLSVLRRPALSAETARNLMVGLGAADDAAVYRISDDLALVETVDFFPPVVDDAWTWGAVAAAIESMLRLNRLAARVARDAGAAGATDITGFGFLGHAGEMVVASGAGIGVDTSRVPFLPQ